MNAEKLKELTDRANKASALAKEIEDLQAANRFTHYLRFTKQSGGYDNALPESLLNALFDLGKAKLIEQKEAELESLLGESIALVVQPVDDHAIGTLDSSDTWEEPVKC